MVPNMEMLVDDEIYSLQRIRRVPQDKNPLNP